MSLLTYEIEHFNPYSPRAQKFSTITSDAPCQLGDQYPDAVVVCTTDIGRISHPVEPLDTIVIRDYDNQTHNGERTANFEPPTTSHFLRRLSSTLFRIIFSQKSFSREHFSKKGAKIE